MLTSQDLSPQNVQELLRKAIDSATEGSWVDEGRSAPDQQLLRLWAARRQAELAAVRDPTSIEAKIEMRRIMAQARRHERRLDGGRWLNWCAPLGPSPRTASLWRTFRAMEEGPRQLDPTAIVLLASADTPLNEARQIARTLFPQYDVLPPPVGHPVILPSTIGRQPNQEAIDGIQALFTMPELIAAIDAPRPLTAPGPDGLPYELFKHLTET